MKFIWLLPFMMSASAFNEKIDDIFVKNGFKVFNRQHFLTAGREAFQSTIFKGLPVPGSNKLIMRSAFENIILKHQYNLYPVVPFKPHADKLGSIDLTVSNTEVTEDIFNDTEEFTHYINRKRNEAGAKFLVGGYNELRAVYGRSDLFNGSEKVNAPGNNTGEPRRLHLGVDIWGALETPVFAPLGGMIHSFAFNHHYGDYGATIILLHQLDGFPFYTLYGHLSLKDLEHLSAGKYLNRGQLIAHFGKPEENGHWPPHLHFQVILDMGMKEGDYPGVCKYSEREKYLNNCPDPDLILQMRKYVG